MRGVGGAGVGHDGGFFYGLINRVKSTGMCYGCESVYMFYGCYNKVCDGLRVVTSLMNGRP